MQFVTFVVVCVVAALGINSNLEEYKRTGDRWCKGIMFAWVLVAMFNTAGLTR